MGVVPEGVCVRKGVSGGVSRAEGVCPGGVHPRPRARHPPREQNDRRCKNIALPQLRLRAVKILNPTAYEKARFEKTNYNVIIIPIK